MQPRFAKPPGCQACSLEHSGYGFAPPSGPVGARLTFIGEALGYEEAIKGEPFYGSAGGVLSRLCHRAGVNRDQSRIANVVSCRPPSDYLVGAPWEDHAIGQCRQYLQPVLDAVPADAVVVTLGATALGAVLNLRGQAGVAVKDFHGTVSRDPSDRVWVVPTFHPSHLQRGAMNLTEIVTQDLRLADRISQRGFARSRAELVVDPHPEWFAQWVSNFLAQLASDPEGTHLALDTEFLEKSGGVDESEVVLSDSAHRSPITRVNGACDGVTGWTVPYRQPYIALVERLLAETSHLRGWIWLWNKYADLDHLWAAGHTITNESSIDAMWLWHYLQSDLPRGLGFVAPLASDFGPWKHWGKDPAREGPYAAADGLQTWRTAMWLLRAAVASGVWDLFLTDWHERDLVALRPAQVQGVPVNRPALEAFHVELQAKLARVLARLRETAAEGVLKPKGGYRRQPTTKCPECGGKGYRTIHDDADDGIGTFQSACDVCKETGKVVQTAPPASILGTPKKGGGEAKSSYMLEGVKLVEREVDVEITTCDTCGAEDVGPKHKCPRPKKPKVRKTRARKTEEHAGLAGPEHADAGADRRVAVDSGGPRRVALRACRVLRTRYFWQLPFNPDAPQQVLAYLASQGIEAPVDKKRGSATTNKKALKALQQQHADDPFFQLQLDWKAVQKVDSTYAVGSLNRLDADDRLHPEFVPAPSTFRDAARNPNLQNVVADKAGPDGLASGFRRCIESRDGVPPGVTAVELAAWQARWGSETT